MDAPPVAGDDSTPSGNVVRLVREGREIFLLGTAHVSRKSVEEVRRVIDELRPDAVCVELDAARFAALTDDTRWHGAGPGDVLRSDRAGLFLASLLFAGFQKRLGDRLGVRPGMEMLAAVEEARRVGAQVVLADREIQATLMRCYRSLGAIDRAKVLFILVALPFTAAELDEADVEKLKDREKMGDVMEAFAREMPSLGTPLIHERDRYLMASVWEAPGKRVVAVVGAAHVSGMTRQLGVPADRRALSVIPSRSLKSVVGEWLPALAVAAMITWTLVHAPVRLIGIATLIAGASAGIAASFAALGGGGILAIACSALLAPMTLLVPLVRMGPLVGLVELSRQTPTSADSLRIRDDVLSPRSARTNPFLRPLLVSVAASFGRWVGGAIGLACALSWLIFG